MGGPEDNAEIESQDHIPKYVQIAAELRAAIATGALGPDMRLPSYTHMTLQYQVAKHTVDRAYAILHQEGLVRREERRGVFVEPKKRSKTGNIGLLLHGSTQYEAGMRALIAGIQEQARSYDVNLMLVDTHEPILRSKIDGLLICSHHLEVFSMDLPANLPRVLLLEPAAIIDVANAVADDFEGSRLATRHLLELGHRRISFMLSSAVDAYAIRRLAGYRAALKDFGVEYDSRFIRYISVPGTELDAEQGMKQWLEEGWRELQSTAILAYNDIGAREIIRMLGSAGLKVPQDISVVGFDGAEAPRQDKIPLTTVEVPFTRVGSCGVELLWEQIQDDKPHSRISVVPVQLKIGQSTRALQAVNV